MAQGIRDFVAAYERAFPGEVVHVTEPVTTDFDVMALVLEYERRRRWPILLFEKVAGADMPIIANVVASRTRARVGARGARGAPGAGVRAAHQGHDQAHGRGARAVPRARADRRRPRSRPAADPDLLPRATPAAT